MADIMSHTRSAVFILTTLGAAISAVPVGQGPAGTGAVLIERTGRYIEEYERAFAALVSEERQVQSIVGADGRVKKTRELRADFLLIKTGPEWAQVFRDIIEVDGKAVRNRDERLRKLFLENPRTAVAQATAIAKESQRHNIGMNRQGNSPLLPLLFLHPRTRARSRFVASADSIAFEEVETPSLLGTRRGNVRFNMPARGTLVVDPGSGRVLSGEFAAIGPPATYSTSLVVKYAEDPRLKLMVPVSVRERYWFEHQPKTDRLEVEATYSNIRRFDVITNEHIKPR
jgi:hypothetical protein